MIPRVCSWCNHRKGMVPLRGGGATKVVAVGPVAGGRMGRWPDGRDADKKNPPRHRGGWPRCVGECPSGQVGSVFGVVADSLAGIHAEDGEVGTPVAEGVLVVALRREFNLRLALLDAGEWVADVHWAPPTENCPQNL